MNYTQLTKEKKAQIDILLSQGLSMRSVGKILNISHSTISRYKKGIYKKRKIDINKKYDIFINYFYNHYDYRNNSIEVCVYMFKKRYKGVICPLFTMIWILLGAIYYLFIAEKIVKALIWFSDNISFSYILGIFTGCIVIDFCYSTKLYKKIKKYAKNNNIDIIYSRLKEHIKDVQKETKEKYSFLLPFKQTGKINEYINSYKEKVKRR